MSDITDNDVQNAVDLIVNYAVARHAKPPSQDRVPIRLFDELTAEQRFAAADLFLSLARDVLLLPGGDGDPWGALLGMHLDDHEEAIEAKVTDDNGELLPTDAELEAVAASELARRKRLSGVRPRLVHNSKEC